MNNVQEGVWHGRGDTICIGGSFFGEGNKEFTALRHEKTSLLATRSPELFNMERGSHHSWNNNTAAANHPF